MHHIASMTLKALSFLLVFGAAGAQTIPPTQTLDATALKRTADALLIEARGADSGAASKLLLKRPESSIQEAVRVKSGQVEWHRDDADILIGVEGSAQIVIGGEIVDGKEVAPGEIRGSIVRGGTTQTFHAGDFVRIEPKVAHQMLLAPGSTLRYMAVKVRVTQ